ncbi:MAG TPA: hypothetical protein VHO24_09100 [Opitutaceae bacterium]|nr:hypothetical protein [Opitutaceae bacterium]
MAALTRGIPPEPTYWDAAGRKPWERIHSPNGTWIWRTFDATGRQTAESTWVGKGMVDGRATSSRAPAGDD